MTIDDWLPRFEFEERHSIGVAAAPEAIDQALREVSLADVRAVQVLWGLRVLPARLRGGRPPAPSTGTLLGQVVSLGGVILEDRPGAIVAGLAGQFWRVSGGELERFATPEDFSAFAKADSCKAVIDFTWGDGSVQTTTRVHVPDEQARRRFARYWRVVGPFSGLIRILLLRAVRRRAEAYDRGR